MKYKFCPVCSNSLSEKNVDGKTRLHCIKDGCGFIFWNNPTPVVAIVTETAHGIIVAHNVNWPIGNYSIITGFLESGETPQEAAIREVKEELALTVTSIRFLGNITFDRMNQLIIAYHATALGNVVLNEELDHWKYVQKNELLGWDETGEFQVGTWLQQMRIVK